MTSPLGSCLLSVDDASDFSHHCRRRPIISRPFWMKTIKQLWGTGGPSWIHGPHMGPGATQRGLQARREVTPVTVTAERILPARRPGSASVSDPASELPPGTPAASWRPAGGTFPGGCCWEEHRCPFSPGANWVPSWLAHQIIHEEEWSVAHV